MKERHIRLELTQDSAASAPSGGGTAAIRAVGWDLAARSAELGLARGSLIDLAYRIRENDHPEFGGLEVEVAGIRLLEEDTERSQAHD
jgi:single-stranded-DNA-specific exonuclease